MSHWWRWLGAACLVLFPLLFIVFGGTGIHPGPSGTVQDQIRGVAAAEARWRLVHLVLAAASLLGIGAVGTLWMLAVRGRSGILAWIGDLGLVLGVAGTALLSGVVLMEAGLVAPLAVACAQSPACLSPESASVADAIAGLGWSNVDPLTWAGGPLATGLLLLGLVGGLLRSLRVWEAALLVLAAIGLLFTNPGLHAPAHYPLLFVLVVFCSLALRWLAGGAGWRPDGGSAGRGGGRGLGGPGDGGRVTARVDPVSVRVTVRFGGQVAVVARGGLWSSCCPRGDKAMGFGRVDARTRRPHPPLVVTDASGRRHIRSDGSPLAGGAVWTQVPEEERVWRVPLAGGPARAIGVSGFGYGLAADERAAWVLCVSHQKPARVGMTFMRPASIEPDRIVHDQSSCSVGLGALEGGVVGRSEVARSSFWQSLARPEPSRPGR